MGPGGIFPEARAACITPPMKLARAHLVALLLPLAACAAPKASVATIKKGSTYLPTEPGRNWRWKGKAAEGFVEVAMEIGGQVEVEGKKLTIATLKTSIRPSVDARVESYGTLYFVEEGDELRLYRADSMPMAAKPPEADWVTLPETQLFAPPIPQVKKDKLAVGQKLPSKSVMITAKNVSHPDLFKASVVATLDPKQVPGGQGKPIDASGEVVGAGKVKVPIGEFDVVRVRSVSHEMPGAEEYNNYALGYGMIRQEIVLNGQPVMTLDLVDMDSPDITSWLGTWSGKQRLEVVKKALAGGK